MMTSTRPHQDQGLQCGGTPAREPPARQNSRSTQSKLTFSRRRLVDVGKETIKIGEKGYYVNRLGWTIDISQALQEAKTKSEHYHFEHKLNPPDKKILGKYTTRFTIAYGSPLFIASKLQHAADGGHVAVLNSASSKNPGGRVLKGTLSAEDCLCRASLLYPCLFQYYGRRDHFYDINLSPPHNGQHVE